MFVAFLLYTSYNWKKYLQKHWKTHFTDRRDMGDTEVRLFYKQFFQILLNVIFVPPPYYIVRWFVKMIERFRTRFFSSNRSPHLTRTFEQKYLSQNGNNDLVELKLKKNRRAHWKIAFVCAKIGDSKWEQWFVANECNSKRPMACSRVCLL